MFFGIVNETTAGDITKDMIVGACVALTKQSAEHVSPWWETTPDTFAAFDTIAEAETANAAVFHIVDDIPEAPDALAYHTLDNTFRPMLRLGWNVVKKYGGAFASGPQSCVSVMSHEAIETKMNPYVNRWVDMADGVAEVSHEACDPVEGDHYDIVLADGATYDGTYSVSNFVGPRWFESGPGPYDFCGKVSQPFGMSPNGYMVIRQGGPQGKTSQLFGANVSEAKKAHVRSYGRMADFVGIETGDLVGDPPNASENYTFLPVIQIYGA